MTSINIHFLGGRMDFKIEEQERHVGIPGIRFSIYGNLYSKINQHFSLLLFLVLLHMVLKSLLLLIDNVVLIIIIHTVI